MGTRDMRVAIRAEPEIGAILGVWSGVFRASTFGAFVALKEDLDEFRDGVPMLHDMRAVDFRVATSEIRTAARAPRLQPPRRATAAFVVEGALGFGMMRMLCQLREVNPLRLDVFDDLDRAAAAIGIDPLDHALLEPLAEAAADPAAAAVIVLPPAPRGVVFSPRASCRGGSGSVPR